MKLATLKIENPKTYSEKKDGALLVVGSDQCRAARVPASLCPNLLAAIQEWDKTEPHLRQIYSQLEQGLWTETLNLNDVSLMAPLPRTWSFLDGSSYVQHIILVRKARNAEPPEDLYTVPLMYQGINDNLIGPNDPIELVDESHGCDYEAEVCVILDEVPMGTKADQAARYIKLFMLLNDVSLRNIIPAELKAGFGFLQGKPTSAFGPFAVTADELGSAWQDGRLKLDMLSYVNGQQFGNPDASEMYFSFYQLIEHAARTRTLSAGTILGSGTVSNKDSSRGVGCLSERRMLEQIETGSMKTSFLKFGDQVELDMLKDGVSVFGRIKQTVRKYQPKA